MKAINLSVCVLVKKDPYLIKFLQNMKDFADEIIAVVSPEEDTSTIELLKKYRVNINFYPWIHDFSWSRNKTLEHANGKWILWLDVDCSISKENKLKIKNFISKPTNNNSSALISCYNHKKDNSTLVTKNIYLFKKSPEIKFFGKVFEFPSINLKDAEPTSIFIDHYVYFSSEQRKKMDYYMQIIMKELIKFPENEKGLYYFILEHIEGKRWKNALDTSNRFLGKYGNRFFAYTVLNCKAKSLFYLDKKDEAITTLEQALKLNPNYPTAYINLAEIYSKTGDKTNSKKYYSDVLNIELDKNNLNQYNLDDLDYIPNLNLGILEFEENEYQKAEKYFIKAHQLRPKYKKPLLYLEKLYKATNQKTNIVFYTKKLENPELIDL